MRTCVDFVVCVIFAFVVSVLLFCGTWLVGFYFVSCLMVFFFASFLGFTIVGVTDLFDRLPILLCFQYYDC